MTTREQIEAAIAEGRSRGYPCSEPNCGVWECEIMEAATAALIDSKCAGCGEINTGALCGWCAEN